MFAWILKTKPEKASEGRFDEPAVRRAGARRSREVKQCCDEGLHAEAIQGTSEENGGELAGKESCGLEPCAHSRE
jgi:hypothetical protein